MRLFGNFRLTTFQTIALGFIALILTGTLLLSLPFASREAESGSFLDCLFTATSAVCVTGLVVRDTATSWTPFGQAVILLLIQIGGMGVITTAITLFFLSGKRIGLMQRSVMQESISAPHMGGIVRLTRFIVLTSLAIEGAGALLLMWPMIAESGVGKGIWHAIFHSVSAFCNAGFDLMGAREPFSSLTFFLQNPLVNLTVILLITIGGIGFLVWNDLKEHGFHWKQYRLQSKIVLLTSLILILLPFLWNLFFEMRQLPWGQRILPALGVDNYDVCFVAIGDDFQSSLVVTSYLKELGAKKVVSRASMEVQRQFLLRNGADDVIYPEKQLAVWSAIRHTTDHVLDYIALDDEFAIYDLSVPAEWHGKTVGGLDIRKKYNLNLLAVRETGNPSMAVTSDTQLKQKAAAQQHEPGGKAGRQAGNGGRGRRALSDCRIRPAFRDHLRGDRTDQNGGGGPLRRKRSLTDRLVAYAPDLDYFIIPDHGTRVYVAQKAPEASRKRILLDACISAADLGLCTLIGFLLSHLGFTDANIIMVYLLGLLAVSMGTAHRAFSLIWAVVSVLLFDLLFTTPRFTFYAYGTGYPVTFLVMFAAAFLISTLANRLKTNASQSAKSARRMSVVLETDRQLSKARTREDILSVLSNQLSQLLKRSLVIYPAEGAGLADPVFYPAAGDTVPYWVEHEKQAVEWR